MDNNRNTIERQPVAPAEKEKIEKKQDSKEVREATQALGEGLAEVVEGVESAETGEVSEKTGEDKKKGPQGGIPVGKGGTKTQIQIKPLVFPKIEVMQIQVATAIHKEIALLQEEARRVSDNAYALSGVVAKIRDLRFTLANLTHMTLGALKQLWLKFVKKSS